jgi:hypothetical protein
LKVYQAIEELKKMPLDADFQLVIRGEVFTEFELSNVDDSGKLLGPIVQLDPK